MDYKDNLQNDGPSKAQILQDRQRLRVMDIYKQSCELKLEGANCELEFLMVQRIGLFAFCGLYPECL